MKKLILLFLIIISTAGIFFYIKKIEPVAENKEEIYSEATEISLAIIFEENIENYDFSAEENLTVLDLLKRATVVEAKNYDFGMMVESINGIKNGEEEKYWLYYVNGEMPMVSADKYELKPGDKVEFKFEKSNF